MRTAAARSPAIRATHCRAHAIWAHACSTFASPTTGWTPCDPTGYGSNRPKSVELRRLGPAALELPEVRIGRERHRGVPQLARFLAARDLREHRAEEGDAVDVDGRGADVVADRVHALVVTLAQRLVVLVGVCRLGQLGGQSELLERLPDYDIEVLVVPIVDPGAHRGVKRCQNLGAL